VLRVAVLEDDDRANVIVVVGLVCLPRRKPAALALAEPRHDPLVTPASRVEKSILLRLEDHARRVFLGLQPREVLASLPLVHLQRQIEAVGPRPVGKAQAPAVDGVPVDGGDLEGAATGAGHGWVPWS